MAEFRCFHRSYLALTTLKQDTLCVCYPLLAKHKEGRPEGSGRFSSFVFHERLFRHIDYRLLFQSLKRVDTVDEPAFYQRLTGNTASLCLPVERCYRPPWNIEVDSAGCAFGIEIIKHLFTGIEPLFEIIGGRLAFFRRAFFFIARSPYRDNSNNPFSPSYYGAPEWFLDAKVTKTKFLSSSNLNSFLEFRRGKVCRFRCCRRRRCRRRGRFRFDPRRTTLRTRRS